MILYYLSTAIIMKFDSFYILLMGIKLHSNVKGSHWRSILDINSGSCSGVIDGQVNEETSFSRRSPVMSTSAYTEHQKSSSVKMIRL